MPVPLAVAAARLLVAAAAVVGLLLGRLLVRQTERQVLPVVAVVGLGPTVQIFAAVLETNPSSEKLCHRRSHERPQHFLVAAFLRVQMSSFQATVIGLQRIGEDEKTPPTTSRNNYLTLLHVPLDVAFRKRHRLRILHTVKKRDGHSDIRSGRALSSHSSWPYSFDHKYQHRCSLSRIRG